MQIEFRYTYTHARTHTHPTTVGARGVSCGDFLREGCLALSVHASVLLGYQIPFCSVENSHMSDLFFQGKLNETRCHEQLHYVSMTKWTEREGK
jgi:hypothetical protein